MKTLHAKKELLVRVGLSGVVSIICILLSVYIAFLNRSEGDRIAAIVSLILYAICLLSLGAFLGIYAYRTHWIQYGNGKVVIRRISQARVNGGPMENKEDTFLLEEIDSYGLSLQVLGHYVEYSGNKNPVECFFKLKNGKIIGFQIGCYTRRQQKEFIRYIYENTRIEFQMSKNKGGEKVT